MFLIIVFIYRRKAAKPRTWTNITQTKTLVQAIFGLLQHLNNMVRT